MSKKKIIIFSSYDHIKNPVYAGGGATAIHEVAKRLTKSFDVIILTGNYNKAKDEIIDNVIYRHIGPSFFGGRFGQIIYHFILSWYALTETYDMWIESFTPPFSTSFTPVFAKKPVIALIHMLSAKNMVRKYHLPFHLIENFGLKFYRHFIVLTKNSKEEIRERNKSADIAVIGNGLYLPPSPNAFSGGKYLAYIGRIEIDQKGLDLLIQAYIKIQETIKIPLLIAGTGSQSEMDKLQKLIDYYHVNKMVHLLGRIDGMQKKDFFCKAMIGITPSRYETFSLVTLEMMSYGIPTIVFDIPGLKWAPNNTIIRVPAFDTNALAQSVIEIISNEELRRNISQNARAYAETCDWDTVAKEYEQYIIDVLSAKNYHG